MPLIRGIQAQLERSHSLATLRDPKGEVYHATTVNSVTGMPNGFAEPEEIRSKLSGMVVALSEQGQSSLPFAAR